MQPCKDYVLPEDFRFMYAKEVRISEHMEFKTFWFTVENRLIGEICSHRYLDKAYKHLSSAKRGLFNHLKNAIGRKPSPHN